MRCLDQEALSLLWSSEDRALIHGVRAGHLLSWTPVTPNPISYHSSASNTPSMCSPTEEPFTALKALGLTFKSAHMSPASGQGQTELGSIWSPPLLKSGKSLGHLCLPPLPPPRIPGPDFAE